MHSVVLYVVGKTELFIDRGCWSSLIVPQGTVEALPRVIGNRGLSKSPSHSLSLSMCIYFFNEYCIY